MQVDPIPLANGTNLRHIIERAAARRAERATHIEGNQTVRDVLAHGPLEHIAPQRQALVHLQQPEPRQRDHGRLLDTRVRQPRRVGDQLAQDGAVLRQRHSPLVSGDRFAASCQHGHENAFASRAEQDAAPAVPFALGLRRRWVIAMKQK